MAGSDLPPEGVRPVSLTKPSQKVLIEVSGGPHHGDDRVVSFVEQVHPWVPQSNTEIGQGFPHGFSGCGIALEDILE